ncbi:Endonuclease/exonuclease/phosphatase [Hirsutella rhossiliensis]|uniref:Endonuclease/exonuclease/phosphatase n=1 Tax=Hirsutella rhossiliensis TaxID=111463 RepID=A0A9P8MPA0_9HYPO|nr:Endonuclease/exonuclease/phosphatase [Hirsutella rhossiliensis]KAH0957686.1 Endonuclease/exonuclease/phosphatase [Hirsutella rhossiliensis]
MRFAARLKSLDEAHPLAKRTYQVPREGFRTRLRRSDQLLPCSRRPLLPRRFGDDQALPLQTAPKDQSAADFRIWLRSVPPHTLVVYSDGSLSSDAAVGYGYAIHLDGQTVLSGCGRLGPAEVFDAEAKGALEDSSQDVFLEFQALATAHAKAGTSQPEPAGAVPTLAYLRRAARQQPKSAFKAWWEASAPEQYKPLHLPTTGCPGAQTPRPLLHHLLAARTRHGDFADYHERFNHDDARLTCSCGRRKSQTMSFIAERSSRGIG